MSEPEPKLIVSRSRSRNKKFRLHNTVPTYLAAIDNKNNI